MTNYQVLVLVLNKIEVLDKLLEALNDAEIKGATVINSSGMAHALVNAEDSHIFGSLRFLLQHDREENRTVFMVLDEEKIKAAKDVIYSVVGDLSKPDTGILFALPTAFVDGIIK